MITNDPTSSYFARSKHYEPAHLVNTEPHQHAVACLLFSRSIFLDHLGCDFLSTFLPLSTILFRIIQVLKRKGNVRRLLCFER